MLESLKKYSGVIFFYLTIIGMIFLISERVKVLDKEAEQNPVVAMEQDL